APCGRTNSVAASRDRDRGRGVRVPGVDLAGGQQGWDAASRLGSTRGLVIARAAIVAALAADAVNLARYYPQTLSHYSLLVGGVRTSTCRSCWCTPSISTEPRFEGRLK